MGKLQFIRRRSAKPLNPLNTRDSGETFVGLYNLVTIKLGLKYL